MPKKQIYHFTLDINAEENCLNNIVQMIAPNGDCYDTNVRITAKEIALSSPLVTAINAYLYVQAMQKKSEEEYSAFVLSKWQKARAKYKDASEELATLPKKNERA